ncbi:phosphoribosylamine--glycine ligase [Marinoscillum pacificum]|uniref:phosphoribosylamine--glycine ligase n=1 Tax=Marinoscillum pacificum TaxID=392723 RepID=UPI002157E20F|nr:phosphoribosylamine--glycine ligase [Marinoscillum pacificum]
MNILVIGSGGREHALAWKMAQSPKCDKLYIAPGNGGTGDVATNLDLDPKNHVAVINAVTQYEIDLVVIGPEDPLVNGLADDLKAAHKSLLVVGPGKTGAILEGSKQVAKDFMKKYGVPTAAAEVFDETNIEEGYKFLESLEPPYVLKADGLAAGKGVLITEDLAEAKQNLDDLIINKQFGDASAKVLIEQFLKGIELSVFVLTDGKDYVILPEAKDYKRIGDGDTGLNTGGMGAVSPVVFADKSFMEKVEEQVVKPTVRGIQEEGMDYCGFIFIGLMNQSGEPYVIEYNVRMGDPETEVVIPRIKSDLVELLEAAAEGELAGKELDIEPYTASTVILVSGGYPESYEKGKEIRFKKEIKSVIPFHAGTKIQEGKLVTNGGRVMALTGLGKNMGEALTRCYAAVDLVNWEGMNYRTDIGKDLQKLGQ